MENKRENIHGFWIKFSDDCHEGIKHLRDDLDYKETKTLCDAARLTNAAEFEDDENRNWKLVYNKNEGAYTLTRRPSD